MNTSDQRLTVHFFGFSLYLWFCPNQNGHEIARKIMINRWIQGISIARKTHISHWWWYTNPNYHVGGCTMLCVYIYIHIYIDIPSYPTILHDLLHDIPMIFHAKNSKSKTLEAPGVSRRGFWSRFRSTKIALWSKVWDEEKTFSTHWKTRYWSAETTRNGLVETVKLKCLKLI